MSEWIILEIGKFRTSLEVPEALPRISIVSPVSELIRHEYQKPTEAKDLLDVGVKRWDFEYDHDAASMKFYRFVGES